MNHLKLKYFLSPFILLICFGFLHFSGSSQNLVQNGTSESQLAHDSTQYHPIDTLELKSFWTEFINAVETKNKLVVKESLSYDLFLAPLIAYPAFVADCDTALFSKQVEFYSISKLTEDNFDQYFDTIFNDNFVEILFQIKIENIMRDGQNTGYSYVYRYVLNREGFPCSDEIVVVINLFYQEGYKVSIEFCC
jgi:hypothetical protein